MRTALRRLGRHSAPLHLLLIRARIPKLCSRPPLLPLRVGFRALGFDLLLPRSLPQSAFILLPVICMVLLLFSLHCVKSLFRSGLVVLFWLFLVLCLWLDLLWVLLIWLLEFWFWLCLVGWKLEIWACWWWLGGFVVNGLMNSAVFCFGVGIETKFWFLLLNFSLTWRMILRWCVLYLSCLNWESNFIVKVVDWC